MKANTSQKKRSGSFSKTWYLRLKTFIKAKKGSFFTEIFNLKVSLSIMHPSNWETSSLSKNSIPNNSLRLLFWQTLITWVLSSLKMESLLQKRIYGLWDAFCIKYAHTLHLFRGQASLRWVTKLGKEKLSLYLPFTRNNWTGS